MHTITRKIFTVPNNYNNAEAEDEPSPGSQNEKKLRFLVTLQYLVLFGS